MMYGSLDMERRRQRGFCHLGPFFAILLPYGPKKPKFWTNEKNAWRYFTNVYHKWQSYDVWFLRYGARRTEFFVSLDHFLPFYPPNDPKNQNFEKIKKNTWRYYNFTHVYHKWQSYYVWFLSLILHQMLTFGGFLNLRKIEAVGFVTITLNQLKR